MNISLPLRLSSVPRSKLLILIIVVFVLFILLFGGIYYWIGFKKGASLPGGPEEYVIVQQIDAYEAPNEEAKVAYIIPGKYFKILERKGRWLRIKMTRIGDGIGAEGWIKASEIAYKPVEE